MFVRRCFENFTWHISIYQWLQSQQKQQNTITTTASSEWAVSELQQSIITSKKRSTKSIWTVSQILVNINFSNDNGCNNFQQLTCSCFMFFSLLISDIILVDWICSQSVLKMFSIFHEKFMVVRKIWFWSLHKFVNNYFDRWSSEKFSVDS